MSPSPLPHHAVSGHATRTSSQALKVQRISRVAAPYSQNGSNGKALSPALALAILMIAWPVHGAIAQSADKGAASKPAQAELPAPPRPKYEIEHFAKLDQALAPVRAIAPSVEDAATIRAALEALRSGALTRYQSLYDKITEPTARKLVDWGRLRGGYGKAEEYRAFLDNNPLWPDRSLLVQRLEEALFTQGGSASSIKAAFGGKEPETGIGYAALASAFLAEGDKAQAKKLASKAWRDLAMPSSLETGFLRRFTDLLDESDHKWRFDRLVTDDVRWASNRKERAAFAARVIPLLSAAEQKKAKARLAVFNRQKNAAALIDKLADDDTDFGLAYHRAQLLRKAGKPEQAAKIILAIKPDPERIAEIDEWWAERRQLAFTFLKSDNAKRAYDLVRDAGPLSVNPLKEQAFMAGWIAWRQLNDKAAAKTHFQAFAAAADGPLSRAKAYFWLGRLADSAGDKAGAREHYTAAARNNDTFHGLLAMQKLEPGRTRLEITPPELPTDEQVRNFNSQDAVKALVIARRAGLSREYTRGFLTALRLGLESEAEAGMIAHLAEALGDTQFSLRIAKAAVARGQNLILYAYPLHAYPAFTPLTDPPEQAFLLGITRQETEFEPKTISGAGAKGLMQVMTVTAKHVCSDYKLKCDIERLMTDQSYNAMIASAYIGDRMHELGDSYILGLVGYNAGPGRARQWIKAYGDPRNTDVDPVDWMELIPITETREYVAKVLSNIQIYRARLGDTANALRLEDDLRRGRKGEIATPAGKDDDETGTGGGANGGSDN